MAAKKLRREKSADALRSIGEAATELDLQTHVLRYWEGKFPKQVRPIKRADGRRMFRPQDMDALRAIQTLVHLRGMTLKGAKALLSEQGVAAVLNGNARLMVARPETADEMPSRPESPARDLQKIVGTAFGAEVPETIDAPEDDGAVAGTPDRLESVLANITDIKRRLDDVRARRAA